MSEQHLPAKIWAIVPAAGSGERMQAALPKQYLRIDDRTVLQLTLERLLSIASITRVQVCIAQHDRYWSTLQLTHRKLLPPVAGGATRAHSVLAGLQALQQHATADDWVLVHDAARPCLQTSLVQKLVDAVKNHSVGGLLALPIVDTVKKADVQKQVETTVDRSDLWAAQTPQMFRFGLLTEALSQAVSENWPVTDESSAVEHLGLRPLLVEGDSANIKMTYPEDEQRIRDFFSRY